MQETPPHVDETVLAKISHPDELEDNSVNNSGNPLEEMSPGLRQAMRDLLALTSSSAFALEQSKAIYPDAKITFTNSVGEF